jgi:hypothetical protein
VGGRAKPPPAGDQSDHQARGGEDDQHVDSAR